MFCTYKYLHLDLVIFTENSLTILLVSVIIITMKHVFIKRHLCFP